MLHYTVCVRASKISSQLDNIFLQQGHHYILKVGYAVPFVIVMTTLTAGIATSDEAYILVQDGEVNRLANISFEITN